MTFDCVFDSYAWIEYLRGTPEGERVRSYVDAGNGATPTLVIAELSAKFHREGMAGWDETREFILARSSLVGLEWPIADQAGKTLKELHVRTRDVGLADAIMLETARALGTLLLTGDPGLNGVEGVEFSEAPAKPPKKR